MLSPFHYNIALYWHICSFTDTLSPGLKHKQTSLDPLKHTPFTGIHNSQCLKHNFIDTLTDTYLVNIALHLLT